MAVSPEKVQALYEALVATNPDVTRKGAKTSYTSRNGHMFSFITKEGQLALRLPVDDLEAFLRKHRTQRCEQHGVVMKEYALVPMALLKQTAKLEPYFRLSWDYIGTLRPKPTTRKKKKVAKKKVAKKKTAAR